MDGRAALALLAASLLVAGGCSGSGATSASASAGSGAANNSCSEPDALASASLRAFVAGLPHGFAYQPLSLAQRNAVRGAARALFAANSASARTQAGAAGYALGQLDAGGSCYWLLQPTAAAPPGQATLLVALRFQRDLIIEAPHVPNDNRSDAEAAVLMSELHARALIVAGAQRCAVTTPSGCHTNMECGPSGVAVQSDPSHSIETAFHAMHLGLALDGQSKSIALQLHTNVYPKSNGDALVSNGTELALPGTPAEAIYQALRAPGVDVRSCNDAAMPPSPGAFCGHTNAQGLASTGAQDSCNGVAPSSGKAPSHRFVHLEQNHDRMDQLDAWSARISAAVAAAIPPTP